MQIGNFCLECSLNFRIVFLCSWSQSSVFQPFPCLTLSCSTLDKEEVGKGKGTKGENGKYLKLLSQGHSRSPRCIYPPLEPGQEDPKTYLQVCFILSLERKTAISLRESLSIHRLSPGSLCLHHLLQAYFPRCTANNQFVQTIVYSFSQAWT